MDLYSMLLCFHLQSSSKMKESEHKKSTHKIILNFNKKEENIAQLSAGDVSMTFMTRERVAAFRFGFEAPSRQHTLDCDAFYISKKFSCSLILCIGR